MRASVEGALKRNDFATTGRGLAELQSRIDGVRARGTAELDLHPVTHGLGQHGQLHGNEFVFHLGRKIQTVAEDVKLPVDSFDDLWVVVTQGKHARAR
jgi:hypothetical protein